MRSLTNLNHPLTPMKNKTHAPFFLSSLLLSAGMSHGALTSIIYESFDYTPGGLDGKTAPAGSGLTGNYSRSGSSSNGFNLSASSLSYGAHPTSGGSATHVGPASGAGNHSKAISISTTGAGSLAGNGLLNNDAQVWFSVLQRTSTDTAHDGFAFALGSNPLANNTDFAATGAEGVGFAISNTGNLTARVSTGPTTHTIGTEINRFSLAETILIVGRVSWGDSSNTVVDLFLPDINMNLGSVVSSASATVDQSRFETLSFHTRRQGNADPALATDVGIDEIRFGASLANVMIPEPSTALLGGLGMLCLLRRRR